MVTVIKNNEFKKEDIKGCAVIDFSATWCGPCKMLKPVFDEVSEEMKDKMAFYNADVDENDVLAQEFGITNIPALVVIKDGVVLDSLVGFKPKIGLVADLESLIK